MIILTKEFMDQEEIQIIERCIQELNLKLSDFITFKEGLDDCKWYTIDIFSKKHNHNIKIGNYSWGRDLLHYIERLENKRASSKDTFSEEEILFSFMAFAYGKYAENVCKFILFDEDADEPMERNQLKTISKSQYNIYKSNRKYFSQFRNAYTHKRSSFWFTDFDNEDVLELCKEDAAYSLFKKTIEKTIENYHIYLNPSK